MIDLSKIPAMELPKKSVSVNVAGLVQEQEITPLSGACRLRAWAHENGEDTGEATLRRTEIALVCGAGMTEQCAAELIRCDWRAAVRLAGEVYSFTAEFETAKVVEAEDAKKNSSTEELTPSTK